MLSALQIASQGFTPLVSRLVAVQGFGAAGGAAGYGGSGSADAARRRYLVRRGNVLMSFAHKEDADRAAAEVATKAPTPKPTRRKPAAPAVQTTIETPAVQLPDSLDLSAAAALAAEQGMAQAFAAAMRAHEYATLVSLYLRALQAQDEDDIEALLLAMH